MNVINLNESKFQEIICYRYPGADYKTIVFLTFLQMAISYDKKLLDVETITKYRKKISNEIFKENGVLQTVDFRDLYYYQQDVGTIGPQNTNIDDPVSVLKVGATCILWNGYHRSLLKIITGEVCINGYVIDYNSMI